MNIDVSALNFNVDNEIIVNEVFEATSEVLASAGIIEIRDMKVEGNITVYNKDDYYLNFNVFGTLIMPCSTNLKPTPIEINANIEGSYIEMMSEICSFERKTRNSIDIYPIIWENILMEIPIKVTCLDESNFQLSGENWQLVTEEEDSRQSNAFDKLKDLL